MGRVQLAKPPPPPRRCRRGRASGRIRRRFRRQGRGAAGIRAQRSASGSSTGPQRCGSPSSRRTARNRERRRTRRLPPRPRAGSSDPAPRHRAARVPSGALLRLMLRGARRIASASAATTRSLAGRRRTGSPARAIAAIGAASSRSLWHAATWTRRCRADQPRHAGLDRLRPLGRVAEDEHRLPECRRLLLDTARVGQDEVAGVEHVDEVEVVERLAQVDALDARKRGDDDRHARRGSRCTGNTTSVSPRATSRARRRRRCASPGLALARCSVRRIRRGRVRRHRATPDARSLDSPEQGVDHGVAGHVDPSAARLRRAGSPRSPESGRSGGRRAGHEPAVGLLGERRPSVARPETGLDVGDRYAVVEPSERAAERRRRVALDDHPIRLQRARSSRDPRMSSAVRSLSR